MANTYSLLRLTDIKWVILQNGQAIGTLTRLYTDTGLGFNLELTRGDFDDVREWFIQEGIAQVAGRTMSSKQAK